MDGTTAIKIDYYEELKAKADKLDEKETPIKPSIKESNLNGLVTGFCGCFACVREVDKYCYNCGQKLDWSESEY